MKKVILLSFYLLIFNFGFSQSSLDTFLKPSDTLNKTRKNTVFISEIAVGTTALVGLNQIWYADYPRSNLHSIDDNSDWLQMDKAGHFYSCYHLGRFGAEALKWSGSSRKNQLIYGSTIGLAFMSTVEVFDGFSSQWGFSWGDMIANTSGTALYVSQELLWKEQRIIPKFSFHTTQFSSLRPNVLGSSFTEQLLKDYNGQTYWLSANLHSFFKQSKIPKWVNVAVGYGADGMIAGNSETNVDFSSYNFQRSRQFYLSLDVDLSKIKTKSHFLATIFSVFNTVKIPAPTLELNSHGVVNFYCLYF